MKFHLISIPLFLLLSQVYSLDNDDKLFRIYIQSARDAELVHHFSLNNSEYVDLWQAPKVYSKAILAQLKGDTLKEFENLGVRFEVANDNITREFENEIQKQKKKQEIRGLIYLSLGKASLADNLDLDQYHSYDEIIEYLKSAEMKSSNNVGVRLITIGETHEKRAIHVLRISKPASNTKKIFLIDCGIHAREWVAVAACLKLIDKFVVHNDRTATEILNKFDVHIIPVLNPDGYEYTRNVNRGWRKNRRDNFRLPICKGVDPNRNFDAAFGTVGVDSRNPCSLIYCGNKAFSEKESQALRDYAISIKNSLHVYLSLHSFSQLLLYPYGYTQEIPSNNDELKRLAALATDAIYSKQGEVYNFGNIYTAIYPASGSTIDWIALNTDAKYSWCFEMRDTGKYGFMLPEELIDPAFIDIWTGIEQLILNIRD